MALKNLLLLAASFTAGFAVPLEGAQEEHLEQRQQACSSVWGQCGGLTWGGATCCTAGNTCIRQDNYYSQCRPGVATTSSTSTVVTTTRTTTSSSIPTSTTTVRTSTTSSSVPTTTTRATTTTSAGSGGSGTATYSGNPFTGVTPWANEYYSSQVHTLAMPQLSAPLATAAAKVAQVPSFMWIDTFAKIPRIEATLADIRAANRAGGNYAGQFVVYDLPDRDCAAAASNGEYAIIDGGEAKYRTYIDTIREVLVRYSDIRTVLVIEPDSLANLVTNLGVPKCQNAQAVYIRSTIYAVQQLNLANVAMYLDGGHAGWLGWPANQPGAASVFSNIFIQAGRPKALRGLATNVANYNAWTLSSAPSYTTPNPVFDEKKYVNALGPLLEAAGWTGVKFITDQGRSGKQPTGQQEWGHWCNAIGTGFGPRPSTNTGDAWVDSFVWIKPGGECDGTSDTSAARYDTHCGLSDALKPAPEAGQWFQAYFVQLLQNANPAFT